jgi:hypothetical protein
VNAAANLALEVYREAGGDTFSDFHRELVNLADLDFKFAAQPTVSEMSDAIDGHYEEIARLSAVKSDLERERDKAFAVNALLANASAPVREDIRDSNPDYRDKDEQVKILVKISSVGTELDSHKADIDELVEDKTNRTASMTVVKKLKKLAGE